MFGSVTWADLGVTICLVLSCCWSTVWPPHSCGAKPKDATAEAKELQHHVFGALGKPLYLLIWIYGIYFAATPLLLKLPADEELHSSAAFFDKLFDLGVFAVLFWLFFRFTHVLEARLAAWTAKTESKLDDLFVPLIGKSLRVIVPVVGIIFALPILGLPAGIRRRSRQRHQHPPDRRGGDDCCFRP